jgi:hypothetical protein
MESSKPSGDDKLSGDESKFHSSSIGYDLNSKCFDVTNIEYAMDDFNNRAWTNVYDDKYSELSTEVRSHISTEVYIDYEIECLHPDLFNMDYFEVGGGVFGYRFA